MSPTVAFVGDALEAAGYRLAGVRVFVPDAGNEGDAFARALAEASAVLVSARVACALPRHSIEAALARTSPLVGIVAESRAPAPAFEPAERVRRQLGIEP